MYNDGNGVCFIANQLGYAKSTVSTILKNRK